MTERSDLVILGAGPAGVAAAIEASALGLRVTIVDEADEAGGQVHRRPIAGSNDRAGDAMRARLVQSGARIACGHRVWHVEPGFRIAALAAGGAVEFHADALIVATGALERHVPVPGWTLPGVMGLAAATIMLKSQRILPGRRIVVAGSGPLLLLVADAILAGGGDVAAIVDARAPGDWLAETPSLIARPDLLLRGGKFLARVLAHRVRIHARHAIQRIEGRDGVERVVITPVDAEGAPVAGIAAATLEADAVCYGFGLMPSTDVTRLLRARHVFAPELGGWTVAADADAATSVQRLYACGDGAGVRGIAAAPLSGRLAALAAARDLGMIDRAAHEARAAPLRRLFTRAARFGAAMTAIATPGPGAIRATTSETIVCRCEGLTRGTLEVAIAAGSDTLNDLKATTRCGMGACGGRSCGDAAARIVAACTNRSREAIGEATGRSPLRPVPLAAITGAFDYADLPIPAPAPL